MKRIELITFGPLQPPYKLKPKQKCLMTQKATHDPTHKRKLLQPLPLAFTQIEKKKLISSPFKRKKNLGLWGECFISSIG